LPVRKLKECLKLWTGQEYEKLVWFSTIKAFLLISISEEQSLTIRMSSSSSCMLAPCVGLQNVVPITKASSKISFNLKVAYSFVF
jgi:hypothetical protein